MYNTGHGVGLAEDIYKYKLDADWLTAVLYQTVYHRYDKTYIFTALIALVTRF